MEEEYIPELGQACFGQAWKSYKSSNLLYSALYAIHEELCRVMWNIDQEEYDSPFMNTANRFDCDIFSVEAYSWNEDYVQPWNFKWNDIEVSWYKYLGRGMSVNRILTNDEISIMLDSCLEALLQYEKEHNPNMP